MIFQRTCQPKATSRVFQVSVPTSATGLPCPSVQWCGSQRALGFPAVQADLEVSCNILQWGYPEIIHSNGIFHYKPSRGTPMTMETSIWIEVKLEMLWESVGEFQKQDRMKVVVKMKTLPRSEPR